MGIKEDIQDFFATSIGVGTIGAGVGYALYKGHRESPFFTAGSMDAITSSVVKKSPLIPSVVRSATPAGIGAFEEAQKAGLAVMGEEGWKHALKKAVKVSALGSGKLPVSAVNALLEEMNTMDPNKIMGFLQANETSLGGIDSVYQNLGGLLGTRTRGHRGKGVAEIITGLGDKYAMSAFGTQGNFWSDYARFAAPADVDNVSMMGLSRLNLPSGAASPLKHAKELETALKSMGIEASVTPGVRDINKGGRFLPGTGMEASRSLGEAGSLRLPYAELRIKMGKQVSYVPLSYSNQGLIASGMGRMSSAAVGGFTIPGPGGTRQLVGWNDAMSMMLYGESGLVGNNLATIIHKSMEEGKTLRQATEEYNQLVRSQVREVTTLPHSKAGEFASTGGISTGGAKINALKHQTSYVPLEEMMVRGLRSGQPYTTAELAQIMEAAEASGIPSFPMESPGAMARGARFSTIPFHTRWDLFGADFPYERRFMQMVRDFEPTEAARKAMEDSRIYGTISRNVPITATPKYVQEVIGSGYSAPNVVMAFGLDDAASLRAEEVLVSSRLAPMLETRTTRSHYVTAEADVVAVGTNLEKGQQIGVDAKSGRPIYSRAEEGMMQEVVVDVQKSGSNVRVTTERVFPLQQQTKTFGVKATLRPHGQATIEKMAEREWGAARGPRWGIPGAEAYGSVDLLKKNPAMIRKQMTEATLLLGAKRLAALKAKEGAIPESLQQVFGPGGRKRIQKMIAESSNDHALMRNLMTLAKDWDLSPEEMGYIGGHWLQLEEKRIAKLATEQAKTAQGELDDLFRSVGLKEKEVGAIRGSRFVLGLPTFYSGDYPTLNQWERGSVDPRGIKEILLQNWETEKGTPVGKMIAEELEGRRVPTQDLDEMESVLFSMGKQGPRGLETLSPEESLARLSRGEGGFMMQLPAETQAFPSKSVYVPSKARLMGYFTSEIGEELPQTLMASYLRLAKSSINAAAGAEGAQESMELAAKGLKDASYKQWLLSSQARGQIAGTTAPVMQSWLGQSFHFETVDDFLQSDVPFKIGVGKETVRESFEDLIRLAPQGEKAALRAEMQRVLKEGGGTGLAWRHPMIFPYSTLPVRYDITGQSTHGIHFPTITIGPNKVDVSGMLAMAADTDFDRANFAVVADKKVESAISEAMDDTRFRRHYADIMNMQNDLEKLAKEHIGNISTDYNKVEGLKRLASMQVATPEVSVAAQKLKSALHHATSPEERSVLSSFVTQLEQRAIQAKKGGEAEIISKAVRNSVTAFTQGEAGLAQTKDEFTRAWTAIWGHETFKAGEKTFNVDEMYDRISALMDVERTSGAGEVSKRVVRRAASANRGADVSAGPIDEVIRDVKAHRAGIGDPGAHLVRSMRQGTGTASDVADQASRVVSSRFGVMVDALKKNWKYPALGIGAAIGARYLFGSSDLDVPDHDQQMQQSMAEMPREAPPLEQTVAQSPQVIQTFGSPNHPSLQGNYSAGAGSYSVSGTRHMLDFINAASGTNVTIRDERGSITPEYIRKQMEERY